MPTKALPLRDTWPASLPLSYNTNPCNEKKQLHVKLSSLYNNYFMMFSKFPSMLLYMYWMPMCGIVQNISRCQIFHFLFQEAKPSEIEHSKFDRVIYFYYCTNISSQYLFYITIQTEYFSPLNSTGCPKSKYTHV